MLNVGKNSSITRVWKNKAGFACSVGKKDKSTGDYENSFMPIDFPKDSVIEHGDEIEIVEGFITFFVTKTGEEVKKVVVQEYRFIERDDEGNIIPEKPKQAAKTYEKNVYQSKK